MTYGNEDLMIAVPPPNGVSVHERLDTAEALIEAATALHGRLARVAIHARPESRLRLMGELALVGNVLDVIENEVNGTARAALKVAPRRHALPKTRRALPPARRTT